MAPRIAISQRTKIVATIGPASESRTMLTRLARAGMDVCRLNMSHGEHAWHARAVRTIRTVSRQTGKPLAILADLQGPKIRAGKLPDGGVELVAGTSVTFTTATTAYTRGKIPTTFRYLHRDIKPKHRILLDDGLLEVVVDRVAGRDIRCTVVTGGMLTSHKGMNLPDTAVAIPALTAKDRTDAAFAVAQGADWIALSFVRDARDVVQLRRLIQHMGGRQRIIVKIEKPQALTNFDAILEAADGVMVARGDLGVEVPAEEVPVHQKTIIEKTRAAGKPVVVATQMLDSMIRNPRPTRAEVSDVANAIIDHTDAIMLSGESATGKYPLEAVMTMARIAAEIEATALDDVPPLRPHSATASRGEQGSAGQALGAVQVWEPSDVVAESAALIAAHLPDAVGILVATATGSTARRVARFRPQAPLFAVTPDPVVQRQLALSYGVRSLFVPHVADARSFIRRALHALRLQRLLPARGRLVVVTGDPWGHPGTANRVTIERVRS